MRLTTNNASKIYLKNGSARQVVACHIHDGLLQVRYLYYDKTGKEPHERQFILPMKQIGGTDDLDLVHFYTQLEQGNPSCWEKIVGTGRIVVPEPIKSVSLDLPSKQFDV